MNSKITFFKTITLGVVLLFAATNANAQLTVSNAMTPVQWVQNVLVGTGVTVSGITYTGSLGVGGTAFASGTFNGATSNIGFASGVLLTSGDINNAPGPNNQTGITTDNLLPGDPDLDLLMSPYLSHDAAILEFDFVTVSDSVKFQYVFASDEYMEFANGGINDGFGFFISGPGITGPYSNNSKNIALIPGTAIPVTINNVNLTNNPTYYFDNGNGMGSGTAPDGQTVQYDGFTVVLEAISAVQCGQTYHIKIAIADGSDGVLDSGVFLKAGSFSSSAVQILPEISYGGPNDSVLYEGCGTACVHFVRYSNLSNQDTVTLTITGAAINGTDYYFGLPGTQIPSQLIFLPGEDSLTICVTAPDDGITEGQEDIQFMISQTGPCATTTTYATMYVNEHSPMQLTMMNDTAFCNSGAGGTLTLNTTVTGGVEPYVYTWTNGAGSVADPVVFVGTTTTYVVSVSDACFGIPDPTPPVTDSVTVTVTNFHAVNIVMNTSISYGGVSDSVLYEGCGQVCIDFIRTSNLTYTDTVNLLLTGSALNGTDYYYNTPGTPMPTQIIYLPGQDTYTFCVDATADANTEGMEDVNIDIVQNNPCVQSITSSSFKISEHTPIVVTATGDTTLCNLGGTALLNATVTGGVEPYTYSWSNGLGTSPNQTVNVTSTTTYTVTVTDACTGTPDPTPDATDTVRVKVITVNDIVVNAGSDQNVCPGDQVTITAAFTGGGGPYTVSWSSPSGADSLTVYNNSLLTALIANTGGTYTLTVTDFCLNSQTDAINVSVEGSCQLSIPNIISSGGSSGNDRFIIGNLENFPGSSLVIYSRWGNKIYDNSDYKNDWTVSKYSAGTYYYVLTISDGRVLPGFFQIVKAN